MPAIIFDRLPEDHVVQMFVTINAKHTRLNPSHLVSLSGRQLYRDEALAAAHDVVRALNDREDSPLHNEIKLLGVGKGRVAQAPLAQEFKRLFADEDALGGPRKAAQFRDDSKAFFVNYFKQVSSVFETAWHGRKYSIRSATALRAFVRVAPTWCGPSNSSTPTAPTSAPSAARLRRGAAASAPCASRPTARGSGRRQRRRLGQGTAARPAYPEGAGQ